MTTLQEWAQSSADAATVEERLTEWLPADVASFTEDTWERLALWMGQNRPQNGHVRQVPDGITTDIAAGLVGRLTSADLAAWLPSLLECDAAEPVALAVLDRAGKRRTRKDIVAQALTTLWTSRTTDTPNVTAGMLSVIDPDASLDTLPAGNWPEHLPALVWLVSCGRALTPAEQRWLAAYRNSSLVGSAAKGTVAPSAFDAVPNTVQAVMGAYRALVNGFDDPDPNAFLRRRLHEMAQADITAALATADGNCSKVSVSGNVARLLELAAAAGTAGRTAVQDAAVVAVRAAAHTTDWSAPGRTAVGSPLYCDDTLLDLFDAPYGPDPDGETAARLVWARRWWEKARTAPSFDGVAAVVANKPELAALFFYTTEWLTGTGKDADVAAAVSRAASTVPRTHWVQAPLLPSMAEVGGTYVQRLFADGVDVPLLWWLCSGRGQAGLISAWLGGGLPLLPNDDATTIEVLNYGPLYNTEAPWLRWVSSTNPELLRATFRSLLLVRVLHARWRDDLPQPAADELRAWLREQLAEAPPSAWSRLEASAACRPDWLLGDAVAHALRNATPEH